MSESLCPQAVELLLSAMYKTRGDDGLESKFMFGPPGAPSWDRRVGTHVFFRRRALIRTALFVRQNGPAYLRSMSIADISSLLTRFAIENYGYLGDETFFQKFECSYADHVAAATKAKLAEVFFTSEIFNPRNELTLYPLVPVKVEEDFDSSSFFLIRPGSLNSSRIGHETQRWLSPEEFPPFIDWKGKKDKPGTWLGIRSPVVQASHKMKAAILGAMALTPHPNYRHQFTMRATFGGRCTIDVAGETTTSYGEAHTPAMSQDIAIRKADHGWLAILASKLPSIEKETRRQVRALEYFYRAWPLDAPERFPCLFMALDAIFGDSSRATQAVIDAIRQHGETNFEYERLRLLLGLRASVIHGGAPDVYDAEKYHRYYETYGDDPIFDLELITARSLRATIFANALVEHPDPHADLIKAYREGTLARRKA